MKTCERLRKIQWLDDYIESQMNQLQKLESQALKINASPLQADSFRAVLFRMVPKQMLLTNIER